jgi:hypothetical protein
MGSKKDTKAMKIMALLSVLFLPPTFVATFYSMVIAWNSGGQSGRQAQAMDMRIYWIITIPLTLAILLAYLLQGGYRSLLSRWDPGFGGGIAIDAERGIIAGDPLGYYSTDICYEP